MKKFTDYEILMVYLQECEDKPLENDILSSPQACKRLAELEIEMGHIENNLNKNPIDEGYATGLWNSIANKLDKPDKVSWINNLRGYFTRSQFSIIGLTAVFVAAIIFYLVGHNQATSVKELDNKYILSHNIQMHLAQTDVFLTQVKNMPELNQSNLILSTAKQLMASNRIIKAAVSNTSSDNKHINQLLTEIEQVLIELANSRHDQPNNYLVNYNKKLLFKVKAMNNQLHTKSSTI